MPSNWFYSGRRRCRALSLCGLSARREQPHTLQPMYIHLIGLTVTPSPPTSLLPLWKSPPGWVAGAPDDMSVDKYIEDIASRSWPQCQRLCCGRVAASSYSYKKLSGLCCMCILARWSLAVGREVRGWYPQRVRGTI